MGSIIRKENGNPIRTGIKQGISKLVDTIILVNRKRDTMSEKGWKAVVIVGIWASLAVMFAATGEVNADVVGGVAMASVIIALVF